MTGLVGFACNAKVSKMEPPKNTTERTTNPAKRCGKKVQRFLGFGTTNHEQRKLEAYRTVTLATSNESVPYPPGLDHGRHIPTASAPMASAPATVHEPVINTTFNVLPATLRPLPMTIPIITVTTPEEAEHAAAVRAEGAILRDLCVEMQRAYEAAKAQERAQERAKREAEKRQRLLEECAKELRTKELMDKVTKGPKWVGRKLAKGLNGVANLAASERKGRFEAVIYATEEQTTGVIEAPPPALSFCHSSETESDSSEDEMEWDVYGEMQEVRMPESYGIQYGGVARLRGGK